MVGNRKIGWFFLTPGDLGCNVRMYDEFHVPDVLIALLYM